MNKLWATTSLGLLVCCGQPETDTAPILRSVRYTEVTNTSGALERTFSGQVQASDESRLSFQVNGRIQAIKVKMGDRVRAGQTLATLDPADFRLDLQAARASYARLKAESTAAAATYSRTKKLFENKNASVAELDTSRASRDSAASAAAAQAQVVQQLKRQLDYASLKARSDGIIRDLSVEENEVISAGQPIGRLQAGDALEVAIDVPETFINRLEQGKEVKVILTTVEEKEVTGTVSEIGVPGAGRAAYPVMVSIPTKIKGLESGMAADVQFKFEAIEGRAGVFRIPTTAVGEDREGTFVFLVKQEGSEADQELGTVARASVTTGTIETDGIDILSGIEEGQKVITAGVSRIYHGLQVKVPKVQEDYTR